MYSVDVVERRLHAAQKSGAKLKRLPREESIGISKRLEQLRYDYRGVQIAEGQLARPLHRDETAFIESERLICKADFTYFFERYACLELDPGVSTRTGIGPPILLESQRCYIRELGKREEICHAELKQYGMTEGIHAYFHKVRQVAATATARAMTLHRMIFWPGSRCLAASLDDERVSELFRRDHVILDNLPFWMRPDVYPDVKDTELGFAAPLSCHCSYQAENQQQGRGGLGVGSQRDISHLTEVALWQYPGYIQFSFWPVVPKGITTLHIQESTANGKGDHWHEVTEAARHKRRGFEQWVYVFIPWWYNRMKYRSIPPGNWVPEERTALHADLVERTSPEFNDGTRYQLSREQMYWWESERARHVLKGQLDVFLTNYPATPEQSFQNALAGALPTELIEKMELRARVPRRSFDVELAPVA